MEKLIWKLLNVTPIIHDQVRGCYFQASTLMIKALNEAHSDKRKLFYTINMKKKYMRKKNVWKTFNSCLQTDSTTLNRNTFF